VKLIWTYDDTAGKSFYKDEHRITLINYYIFSITNAKQLGYETIIYTTNYSKKYFENIVDEIIVVDRPYDTKVWDYLKIYVLENRNDNFCLIDGDLILNKKLPIFTEEVLFDSVDDWNWEYEYNDIVKQFANLKINEIIEFWSTEKIPTMNLGILYIGNDLIKNEYIQLWKKMNEWLNIQTEEINFDLATMVISQYLLTLICNKNGVDRKSFRKNTTTKSDFYNHYIGDIKFKQSLVPNDTIIKINKTFL
jgi:hypothetical protein